jgi:general secretion pathway protein J
MTDRTRQSDAGLSLVEMLVALVLFALVGLASFAMLDAIIKARDRTEGRLAGIAQLDRALTLFTRDLGQSLDGRSLADGQLGFTLSEGGAVIQVAYRLQDGALLRSLTTDAGTEPLDQVLITGVDAAHWRFLDAAGQWADVWPPPGVPVADDGGPQAVDMELTLASTGILAGSLRRIVELPRAAAQ